MKHRVAALFARLHRRVSRIEDDNAEIAAALARIEAAVVEGNRTLLAAIQTFTESDGRRAEIQQRHQEKLVEHDFRIYNLEQDSHGST